MLTTGAGGPAEMRVNGGGAEPREGGGRLGAKKKKRSLSSKFASGGAEKKYFENCWQGKKRVFVLGERGVFIFWSRLRKGKKERRASHHKTDNRSPGGGDNLRATLARGLCGGEVADHPKNTICLKHPSSFSEGFHSEGEKPGS